MYDTAFVEWEMGDLETRMYRSPLDIALLHLWWEERVFDGEFLSINARYRLPGFPKFDMQGKDNIITLRRSGSSRAKKKVAGPIFRCASLS